MTIRSFWWCFVSVLALVYKDYDNGRFSTLKAYAIFTLVRYALMDRSLCEQGENSVVSWSAPTMVHESGFIPIPWTVTIISQRKSDRIRKTAKIQVDWQKWKRLRKTGKYEAFRFINVSGEGQ